MTAFFSADFLFRNAILGGLGVAVLCSVLGIYLVLRRLVLIGVALPQASAAKVAPSDAASAIRCVWAAPAWPCPVSQKTAASPAALACGSATPINTRRRSTR